MNKRMTPILLVIAVLLGLAAYFSEHPLKLGEVRVKRESRVDRIFNVARTDIVQVRIKRDFWNTFALARGAEGKWKLTEPSDEPAMFVAVETLLETLESLPVISTVDLPGNDTERYRQFGLWEPMLEVTVSDGKEAARTLRIGAPTTDGKGVYCVIAGSKKVYVTSADAVKVLCNDVATYRMAADAGK